MHIQQDVNSYIQTWLNMATTENPNPSELENTPDASGNRNQSGSESSQSLSQLSDSRKCIFTPPELDYAISELRNHFKSTVINLTTGTEQKEARDAWVRFKSNIVDDLLGLDSGLVGVKTKKGASDLVLRHEDIFHTDPIVKVKGIVTTYGQYIVDNHVLTDEKKKKVQIDILKIKKLICDFEKKFEEKWL